MIDGIHCQWCGLETKLFDDECIDCARARYWMESNPKDSLYVAAKMLSMLFTKHNNKRGGPFLKNLQKG